METENIVTPPNDEYNTASRWDRLWASLIDSLIMMMVVIPVMYFTGGFDGISEGVQPSLWHTFFVSVFGIGIFFLINWKLLSASGQTIGKRTMGIKIVTLTGDLPGFKEHLLKRYGVYFLLGQVPVVGQFLSIANGLVIFGKQRRCGHDFVAGTVVVNC